MGYIHGEQVEEQNRLLELNRITNENFLEYLGNLHNKNICEVGSGLGVLTTIIANINKDSFITGIEISKANYEVALKNTHACPNIKLLNDDFLDNKFREGEFDVTFCRYVLEHVSDAQKVVDEMIRITKKGGIIICQENDLYNGLIYPPVPNYQKMRRLFAKLQEDMGGDPFVGRKLYSFFSDKNLESISFGIKPEIHTQDDPEFPMWINNLQALLMGVKEKLIGNYGVDEAVLEQVCSDLGARIKKPIGTYLFQWNRIKVVK